MNDDMTGVCTSCGARCDPNELEYDIENCTAMCLDCVRESDDDGRCPVCGDVLENCPDYRRAQGLPSLNAGLV